MISTLRQACRPCLVRGVVVAPLVLRQAPLLWLPAKAFSTEDGPHKPPKGCEKVHQQAGQNAAAKDSTDATGKKNGSEGKAQPQAKDKTGPSEKAAPSGKEKSETSGKQPTPDLNQHKLWVAALGVMALAYAYSNRQEPAEEITLQEMIRDLLMKGYVEKIQVVNFGYMDIARVFLRHDAPSSHANKEVEIVLGNPEVFEAKIEQAQREMGVTALDFVPIQYTSETELLYQILPWVPMALTLVVFATMAKSMQGSGMGGGGGGMGKMFSMGKAFPAGTKDLKSTVTFADVAGMEQAKKEVVEFVDFLKHPAKFEHLGARCPKGGLLVGPPGTGKTLLAKAVAGEAGVPFYSMSGSDFVEMYVGVGPSRVRDLFAQARETAPSIIFLDEIDAVGKKRGGSGGASGGGNDERENTLNQLLVEMDGFASGTGVIVLAGTNRADVLDAALLRPGRFDRQIAIDKPDLAERGSIFNVHLKPVVLSKNIRIDDVAKRMAALTPGFAGADIANVCNEAAIFAARRNAESVEMVDFERATERVIGGLPKQNGLMSLEERKTVALHESGHAVAGWFLEHTDPLLKVSIVPRSNGALGFAQYLPDEVRLHSKEAILDRIAMALGGRAAEEMFVGRITTGASDDLDKVTKMAHAMVSVYGMNPELGLVSFNQDDSSQQFYKPYSERIAQIIDKEVRELVDEQYTRVKALLHEKRDMMLSFSSVLVEKETMVYNDIKEVFGERPFGIKAAYAEFVTAGASPFSATAAAYEGSVAACSESAAETNSFLRSAGVDYPGASDAKKQSETK